MAPAVFAVALAVACDQNTGAPPATQTASVPPPPPQTMVQIAPDLPPLPPGINASARPPEVTKAVYEFAARHPEVLKYMPCFCGCERMGHKGNDDCFVAGRDAQGKVKDWEYHGMGCEICIDIGQQAMQMHNAGATRRGNSRGDRQAVQHRRPTAHADAETADQGQRHLATLTPVPRA